VNQLDLGALFTTLRAHDVDYVLIGGVAVAAHGYLRTTADADIVPDPGHDNLRRLGNALVSLNATLPLAGDATFDHSKHGRALERRRNLTLETSQGALDIVQDARGVPSYATLNAAAVDAEMLGVDVRICSLGHLKAMKQAAGRLQDKLDLEHLPPG